MLPWNKHRALQTRVAGRIKQVTCLSGLCKTSSCSGYVLTNYAPGSKLCRTRAAMKGLVRGKEVLK